MSTFGMHCAGFVTAVLVSAALAAGCTTTASAPAGSALGESCTKTADCQSGLVCLANACVGAGRSVVAPDSGTGDAGGGVVASSNDAGLSRIGETCQTTRDCAPGLDCVPSTAGASVCDLVSYGITPGSKTCSGECSEAAHCCAFPTGLAISGTTDAGAFFTAQNCEDILLVLLGGNASVCSSQPTAGTSLATACFYYQTYCNCPANTWACNGGRCVYTASCQTTVANTLGGCPSFTRTRSALNTTCVLPGNKCRSASSGCSTDSDCDGLPVVDLTSVSCRGGDCACSTNACYLKCAKDLDCQTGYSCDATKQLCVPTPCTNDAECFSRLGKARAACKSGVCGIPCTVDHDCSPSGDISGQPFNGTVCGPDGVCAPVGCTSDADCAASGSTRLFCAAPAVTNVRSAITN